MTLVLDGADLLAKSNIFQGPPRFCQGVRGPAWCSSRARPILDESSAKTRQIVFEVGDVAEAVNYLIANGVPAAVGVRDIPIDSEGKRPRVGKEPRVGNKPRVG